MMQRFTLGIEEELQMVDRNTGQLVSCVHTILDKGSTLFGDQLKAEMLQSVVEIATNVCPNITALRLDLQELRSRLARLIEPEGLALIAAGTHPQAHWRDQLPTFNPRYEEIQDEYQDVSRSILICGLHIHVGIDKHEIAVPLMNQLRTWIPHLLALSSNSPFWVGHPTGLKSYRSIVWKRFPRSGISPSFASTGEYDTFVENITQNGCIDNAKKIWWDIRPHPFFGTIEFRICDMPATYETSIAIAALCQALVAKLTWLHEHNMTTHVYSNAYIEENKWKAARYGLDAPVIDFVHQHSYSMRNALHALLDFVDDVVDDLNSRHEINFIRTLLDDPAGTGADRQLAIYRETNSLQAVTNYLMQQTMAGVTLDTAL